MEGPSLFLAQEQLQPFCDKKILKVYGNSKIDQQLFDGKKVHNIFAWGKHLVFQFDEFALRVHFMLFGTFEASVKGKLVTGDYPKAQVPRLAFEFENGNIHMFNCSVKIIEGKDVKKFYDFTVDVMSKSFDLDNALQHVKQQPGELIGDVLLDQEIFAGVGNIIKNEVLWMEKIHPDRKVADISDADLKSLIQKTVEFSHQFYVWRKAFVLRKNLVIYRKKTCPRCGGPVTRQETGIRKRISHFCPVCQV